MSCDTIKSCHVTQWNHVMWHNEKGVGSTGNSASGCNSDDQSSVLVNITVYKSPKTKHSVVEKLWQTICFVN